MRNWDTWIDDTLPAGIRLGFELCLVAALVVMTSGLVISEPETLIGAAAVVLPPFAALLAAMIAVRGVSSTLREGRDQHDEREKWDRSKWAIQSMIEMDDPERFSEVLMAVEHILHYDPPSNRQTLLIIEVMEAAKLRVGGR